MNIICRVGDLVLPLVCPRCGHREFFIVGGDDASKGEAAAKMQAHACVPKEAKEPS